MLFLCDTGIKKKRQVDKYNRMERREIDLHLSDYLSIPLKLKAIQWEERMLGERKNPE